MKPENQLKFVRDQLAATPPSEWADVAASAKLNLRTLYNVARPTSTPAYPTVFDLYQVLAKRAKKAGKANASK